MRITVMGSGGVGGYFGARLAAAGNEVTFVARGAHLAAIRENGLRVLSPLGDVHLSKPRVTEHAAEAGSADFVLFGVKLWDTIAAAQAIKPLLGDETAVVSFQNGVGKDAMLGQVLGDAAVAGGACYISATIEAPGVIRHIGSMARLAFGEFDGRASPRLTRFAAACQEAGIDHELSPRIQVLLWEKFVFLASLAAATAASRLPIGAIRSDPRSRALLADLMEEVVQVARAEGVAIAGDFVARRMAFADSLPAAMKASMAHDLERGQRLELPWLSGDVVARGQRLGVPTPCHRVIADLLAPYSNGRADPS